MLLFKLKLALSSYKNSLGFVFTVFTTLSLTLAGLFLMMALNYVLFLKPLPYEDQDKLFAVGHVLVDEKNNREFAGNQIYSGLAHWHKNQNVFESSALLNYESDIFTSHPQKPLVNTTYVSPEFLGMLGTRFAIGSNFSFEGGLLAQEPVAVISHEFYQKYYSQKADILSEKLAVAGSSFRVIGVLNKDFVEPELFRTNRKTDIWLPWSFNPAPEFVKHEWGVFKFNYLFAGRLKSGVSPVQAESALSKLLNTKFKEETVGEPFFNDHIVKADLTSFEKRILGDSNKAALLFLLGAIALLLIASVNVSNLLLSRTVQRQKKLAIHAAVGASPGNLFKSIFFEYFILVFISVIAALGFAYLATNLVKVLGEQHFSRMSELQIDLPIMILAAVIGLVLTSIFTFITAKKINYEALQSSLQSSSGKGTSVQVSSAVLRIMVTSQLLLCILLISANFNLLSESVRNISTPLGLEVENLDFLTLKNNQLELSYDEQAQLIMEIKKEIRSYPGVEEVAQTPYNPLDTLASLSRIQDTSSEQTILVKSVMTDQFYLPVLETSILAGNNFSDSDVQDETNRIIVSESIANELFGNQPLQRVVGEQIFFKGDDVPYKVIGVVENISNPRSKVEKHIVYTPVKGISPKFLIKTTSATQLDRVALTRVVQNVSRSLNVAQFEAMSSVRDSMLRRDYLTAYITVFVASLALFLALTGIYGVLSYSTLIRKGELGIRLAIGATPKDMFYLIFKDNCVPLIVSVMLSCLLYAGVAFNLGEQLSSYIILQYQALFASLVLVVLFASIATVLPCYRLVRKETILLLK